MPRTALGCSCISECIGWFFKTLICAIHSLLCVIKRTSLNVPVIFETHSLFLPQIDDTRERKALSRSRKALSRSRVAMTPEKLLA